MAYKGRHAIDLCVVEPREDVTFSVGDAMRSTPSILQPHKAMGFAIKTDITPRSTAEKSSIAEDGLADQILTRLVSIGNAELVSWPVG